MAFGAKKKQNSKYSYYQSSDSKKNKRSVKESRKCLGDNLSFAASEAYKLLRTNLIFSLTDEDSCKTIGVTSALRGEGKSTTSMNLAYTFAQTKSKVLLIEADMRIPVVGKLLGIDNTAGLSHVLAGMVELKDAIKRSEFMNGLYVITAGDIPPNPSELLSSKRMEMLVETLKQSFDYIIIDLPPITAVSDGLAVSKLVSGMLVVVRKDYCDRSSLDDAMRQLEFLDAKILGFVFNDADSSQKGYFKKYGKYYKKDYGKYGRSGYYKKSPYYIAEKPRSEQTNNSVNKGKK